MRIFLRRFDGEPVEVSGAAAFGAFDLDENERKDEAGRQVRGYWVDIADDVQVVPVDWRRFAWDVDVINRAIALCVKDNVIPFAFEPRTPDLPRRCEAALSAALRDLASIISMKGVECCVGDEGEIQTQVDYELTNGRRCTLAVKAPVD